MGVLEIPCLKQEFELERPETIEVLEICENVLAVACAEAEILLIDRNTGTCSSVSSYVSFDTKTYLLTTWQLRLVTGAPYVSICVFLLEPAELVLADYLLVIWAGGSILWNEID